MRNINKILFLTFIISSHNLLWSVAVKGSKEEARLMLAINSLNPGSKKFVTFKLVMDQLLSSPSNPFIKELIKIYTNNFRSLATLRGHAYSVYSFRFSPDGNYAISGSTDGTIKIW